MNAGTSRELTAISIPNANPTAMRWRAASIAKYDSGAAPASVRSAEIPSSAAPSTHQPSAATTLRRNVPIAPAIGRCFASTRSIESANAISAAQMSS